MQFRSWLDMIREFYIPVSIVLALGFVLLLWLCLRLSFGGAIKKGLPEPSKRTADVRARKPAPEVPDQAAVKRSQERLYIHLFSILQREGRLMDFFAEDIEEYEDEDIGAAVRNIHENCRKIIDKYLIPKSILADEEDSEITVEPGFDPNAIKLTGNVTGNPPFKGSCSPQRLESGKTRHADIVRRAGPAHHRPRRGRNLIKRIAESGAKREARSHGALTPLV